MSQLESLFNSIERRHDEIVTRDGGGSGQGRAPPGRRVRLGISR